MDKEFKERLQSMNDIDKSICNNYFVKREAIDKILNVLRKNELIKREPFGNANSKVCFVVDFEKTNDKSIEIIKKYYEANNLDVYNSYFTPFEKTDNVNINIATLEKELAIIKPERVVFITNTSMPKVQGSMQITMSELDIVLKYGKIKDNATPTQKDEYTQAKAKLHKIMEFAILGRQCAAQVQ